jgi:putative two-component system response regulator
MSSFKILCVDDEPSNLELLRVVLQDEYKLVFACCGTDALRAASKHEPDLILLDVQMPDLSGFEVCRRLKQNSQMQTMPVIFVTGLTDEVDEQAGFDTGAVDYITKPISAPIVRARVRTHLSLVRATELKSSQLAAIHMLGEAGHYNDSDTGVHIWRMAAYCRVLALTLGWSEETAALLELAAPMHDTGKIGISDAILKKPGKLDAAEWRVMKTHARIGYDILSKSSTPLFKLAAEIALHHHEKWDGSGYPEGLSCESISEAARIVAVADVFDALTMRRPYKEAWPLDRVVSTVQSAAGNHLDARLVSEFMKILPEITRVQALWNERELHALRSTQVDSQSAVSNDNQIAKVS